MSAAEVTSAGSSGKAKNFPAKCYSVSSRPKTKVTIRPRTLTAATIPRTAGMPNLPFKIGRTKTPKRSDLRDASSEAASSSNVSRCGGVTSANASASCYGPISRRPPPDDTCVEFPPDSRSALEIAYPFLPSGGQ